MTSVVATRAELAGSRVRLGYLVGGRTCCCWFFRTVSHSYAVKADQLALRSATKGYTELEDLSLNLLLLTSFL